MSIMSLFDVFKKRQVENDYTTAQSIVCYNAELNFIVLVQYGYDDFYDALEFVEAATRAHLKVIVSHMAEEQKVEKGEEAIEGKLVANKPTVFINHRFYILVSGTDQDYKDIYNILSLSNSILSTITKDIYANRSSSFYENLIKDTIFEYEHFVHQKVAPKYDHPISMSYDRIEERVDDISKIIDKLPLSYSPLEIARIINIYSNYTDSPMSADEFAKWALEPVKNSDRRIGIFQRFIQIYKVLLGHKEISMKDIEVFTQPIYNRNDLSDNENFEYPTDKSIEDMDNLFQEQYDRFNPFAIEDEDNPIIYKDIDEQMKEDDS